MASKVSKCVDSLGLDARWTISLLVFWVVVPGATWILALAATYRSRTRRLRLATQTAASI